MLVTYADRSGLCKQVVERLVEIGISRVLIVDNASIPASRRALIELEQRFQQVSLLVNEENLGSGGGFRRAFEVAFAGEEDFFFLLDDDNLPDPDCVNQLLLAHRLLEADHRAVMLYANRGSTRQTDMKVFRAGFTKQYLPNSFCSFVLKQRLFGRVKRLAAKNSDTTVNYPVVRVHYGPYGGMFGRQEVFSSAGLPRQDYFLYADDHEYATRLEKQDVAQFLIEPARIEDLDVSFEPGYFLLSDKLSPMRVYYQIRNHTHLSQYFIKSRRGYSVNKYGFLLWETLKGWEAWRSDPKGTLSRWRLLRRAMSDGEAGRLGRSFDI